MYQEKSLKANTIEKYKTSLKRLCKLRIAKAKISKLSSDDIQKCYNEMSKEYSRETIVATNSLVNGALIHAENQGHIKKNPCRSVKIPKGKGDDVEDNIKALTEIEYKNFMHQMEIRSDYYIVALFLSNTGLRIGEAIALKRSDFDFTTNRITINKTHLRDGSIQGSTKTLTSKRIIPIPEGVSNLLLYYMENSVNQGQDDFLFQTLVGNSLNPRNVLRAFKTIADDIALEWVNSHTLRHTYASRLFAKKIDIKVISQLLGHSSVKVTYDTYIHFITDIVEDSVKVLDVGIPTSLFQKLY
jgi:integrase